MFVHYFTEIESRIEDAVARVESLRVDMATWAGSAYREGEHLAGRLTGKPVSLAGLVLFDLGEPEISAAGHLYPLRWRATGARNLFPLLKAELILADMSGRVLISLRGVYDPPLGALGRLVDRALLSRVADATIKSWVDQLADGIVGLDGNDDLNNRAPSMLRRDRNVTAEPKGPGPQVTEAHART
ncbi:MAG TPA: hypothetical protein VFY46_04560 [Acidimicrobiia bacterium]|nr:hypothetical protein [Acidimicrobiia bacterium]